MGDRSVNNALVMMSTTIKRTPHCDSVQPSPESEVSHLQRTRRRGKDRTKPLGLLAAAAPGLRLLLSSSSRQRRYSMLSPRRVTRLECGYRSLSPPGPSAR